MFKGVWKVFDNVGRVAAALSLCLLATQAYQVGLTSAFEAILRYYEWLRDALLSPLQPIARSFVSWFAEKTGVNFVLRPHWNDIFVLMSLYLGARASSYWVNARQHAMARVLLAILISFVTSVLSTTWDDQTIVGGVKLFATVVMGLITFDVLDAAWASALYRKTEQTFLEELFRYLNYSGPTILVAIFTLVFSGMFFIFGVMPQGFRFGLGTLVLLPFTLSVYWLFRAWELARKFEERNLDESRWSRFLRSSNTKIASAMMSAIIGVLIFFLANAGHSLFIN